MARARGLETPEFQPTEQCRRSYDAGLEIVYTEKSEGASELVIVWLERGVAEEGGKGHEVADDR